MRMPGEGLGHGIPGSHRLGVVEIVVGEGTSQRVRLGLEGTLIKAVRYTSECRRVMLEV